MSAWSITRRLGDFRTSMLNDVEAGRALEVEGLLGAVVELAEKLGEPVPASRVVYALARGTQSLSLALSCAGVPPSRAQSPDIPRSATASHRLR